jgi:replication factor A1
MESKPSNPYRAAPLPVANAASNGRSQPISSLNPYNKRWCIKGRVTNKGDMRTWQNAKGSGSLFSFDLLDAEGGEIRATCFKDTATKLFDVIEVDQVYFVSNGQVKMANKNFSTLKGNYELTLGNETTVMVAQDDTGIKRMNYNFTKLAELEALPENRMVDVIGVLREAGPLEEFTAKSGKDLVKRDLTILDDSNTECKLTLWGEKARQETADWGENAIVAVKSVKVSEFNGKSLNSLNSTQMLVNANIPEAEALKTWFENDFSASSINSLTVQGERGGGGGGPVTFADRKTFKQITDEGLGFGEKPDYVTMRATVINVKYDQDNGPWYHACPEGDKPFKVIQEGNGEWRCEKLNKTFPNKTNRYVLPVCMADHTGSNFTTYFDDIAKQVLDGKSADELQELKETDATAFEGVFKKAMFTDYVVRMRVKNETYNEEARMKYSIVKCQPVDYAKECASLIADIKRMDP